MNIVILGGDGYLGWATAMHLSALNHNVTVVDNYLRRSLSRKLNREALIRVPRLEERAAIWKAATGREIAVRIGDVTNFEFLGSVFQDLIPDTVIHYAEQPSAPYSMMGQGPAAQTMSNNLMSTLNVVYAIRDIAPACHLVKLGTMGEYGTPNIDIEEGYLNVTHNGREHTFLYPKTPGSIYHLTKVQDSDLLYFAARMWNLAVTDLNQGPVYGIETDEISIDGRLAPLFNYDDIFGTVLNRFIVQAVAGLPLTVYGKGGQVRGYLNLCDTLQCVRLATENPASYGEFRVLNQFTETFTVMDLAKRVRDVGCKMGLDVRIAPIQNPRKEAEEHYYNPKNTGLLDLGLEPHYLTDDVISGILGYVHRHANQIDPSHVLPQVQWN